MSPGVQRLDASSSENIQSDGPENEGLNSHWELNSKNTHTQGVCRWWKNTSRSGTVRGNKAQSELNHLGMCLHSFPEGVFMMGMFVDGWRREPILLRADT